MKLFFSKPDFSDDNATILVNAALNSYSSVRYASILEERIYEVAVMAHIIRSIVNYKSWSIEDYEYYDDLIYFFGFVEPKEFKDYTESEKQTWKQNHLDTHDFLKLAKRIYKRNYDRIITINGINSFRKEIPEDLPEERIDSSYWVYRVIVQEGFNFDENRTYYLDEIKEMYERRQVIIISCYSADEKVHNQSKSVANKYYLDSYNWFDCISEPVTNEYFMEYFRYIKKFVTDKLIKKASDFCLYACKRMFEMPSDEQIKGAMASFNSSAFYGKSDEEFISYVKRYVSENDLLNHAKEIIFKYSCYGKDLEAVYSNACDPYAPIPKSAL